MPSPVSRALRALAGAIVVIAALLGFFWSAGSTQAALSDATQQLAQGDVSRLQPYIDDLWDRLLSAGLGAMLIPLLLGFGWVWSAERDPPAGDAQAAARRGSWTVLLIATLVLTGLAIWFVVIHDPIAVSMAPGLGVKCLVATEIAAAAAYYLVTALGVFRPSRVSVPGASALLRDR